MSRFIQYEMVRVRKILFPESDYDGWRLNKRKPQVGDTGTLIDILEVKGLPPRYAVESSGKDGITIFLSEFIAEEIEPVRNEN
jgi:hypothetical protein